MLAAEGVDGLLVFWSIADRSVARLVSKRVEPAS